MMTGTEVRYAVVDTNAACPPAVVSHHLTQQAATQALDAAPVEGRDTLQVARVTFEYDLAAQ